MALVVHCLLESVLVWQTDTPFQNLSGLPNSTSAKAFCSQFRTAAGYILYCILQEHQRNLSEICSKREPESEEQHIFGTTSLQNERSNQPILNKMYRKLYFCFFLFAEISYNDQRKQKLNGNY